MAFEWISAPERGRGSNRMFVSIDSQGRLCLSSALRRELGCVGIPIHLYVGYDKVNRRIALAKPDVVRKTDIRAYKFDTRGYTSATELINRHRLPTRAHRYYFDGREDGMWTFRLEAYEAPDAKL